ncbi:MAG: Gfo/Idh/MocA family oxidoreductase [Lentisphaerae bacterium]|jgi:predicted dehydrogenase|nr:Gfo/Idh/MocA family oxidoreductase [Lentisphaerota bacterium]MBT4822000.1 Gfo/Idh/MocA family oxidoreductase [Lentisphaerota bacterium]MBT5609546.1 Gfo/Idh/MocA family oxidoreductase [Lentisphaerota bacterium]MBT7058452.1 Gfo/Idh/MocA family oxidoreductase [Lentisphaerota bacterium]MBT7843161.1 Gfo/Idh/MocA family oxidoreductase [Lentisphaerota bacterium]
MAMTRREFVQSMAAAGTGVVLSNSVFGQAAGGGDEINVALLGAGTQGRVLMGDCMNIEGIRFRAVCDIWNYSQRYASRRMKAQYKRAGKVDWANTINVYEDYREMLDKEKDLDAVIVATPDFVHAEHAIACAEAGRHVYCEKEMSNTLENARKMVEAQRKTGKLMQIGHQRRSNPVYQYALELIKDDDVCGRLTNCYGQWNRGVQPLLEWPERYVIPPETLKKYGYESMEQFRNWRWYRKYSAGPIADLGSHQIDIFSWFLHSDPTQVVAMGGSDYFEDREWYEDVLTLYQYPYTYKGKTGTARAFYQILNTNSYGHYFERFSGDGGALTISENPKKCFYVSEPGKELPEWLQGVEPVQQGGKPAIPLLAGIAKKNEAAAKAMEMAMEKNVHQMHLENFFEAVRAGDASKLSCPPEEAYKTAVAVLQVIPAVEAGGGVTFKPEDFKA